MAAPSYITAAVGATDATGAWSYTSPSPGAVGRVYIVQLLQDGTAAAPTISSVTNAEQLNGTDNNLTSIGSFAVGNPTAANQHLWIGRSTSTSAMVITGANAGGDDVYVRVYVFSDVSTGTTLATVIENIGGTSDLYRTTVGTSSTPSPAQVTSSGPDRVPINCYAVNDDNTFGGVTGSVTGGDWTQASPSYAESSGTDGMIAFNVGAFSDVSISEPSATLPQVHGESGTNEQRAQSFQLAADRTGVNVHVQVGDGGTTPVDNLIVEIQTDSGGAPSGVVVGTSDSLTAADVTPAPNWRLFETNASLSASTTYWVVIRRDGARDTVNFYALMQSSTSYAGGTMATRNSGTWTNDAVDLCVRIAPTYLSGTSISGGSVNIVDSDAWGVVGFALIGTTVSTVEFVPRHPAINHQNPGLLAKAHDAWQRTKGGIFVPRLWTPEGAQI